MPAHHDTNNIGDFVVLAFDPGTIGLAAFDRFSPHPFANMSIMSLASI